MGQTVGRMPDTWEGLVEEKDRVLRWSGEVLAKIADNVNEEESFQIDYDNTKIDGKIDSWINSHQERVRATIQKCPNAAEECKNQLTNAIAKVAQEYKMKMRKDYQNAYGSIKRFTKKVDEMGIDQRKIHGAVLQLEEVTAGDAKKFQKKFGPLRVKTFDHLKTGEKMMIEDKKLKTEFVKKVNEIDRKNSEEIEKKITKLLTDFEKAGSK